MSPESGSRRLPVIVTLVVGLMLSIMPLPDWLQAFRPDWVALLLIFWSMQLPRTWSVGFAWIIGIVLDVSYGTLLGQHALAYALAIYIVMTTYKRLRLTPMWQQAFAVFLLLMIERIITAIVIGATRSQTPDILFWLSPLTGMLLWPWLFILLRDVRRKFRMQ